MNGPASATPLPSNLPADKCGFAPGKSRHPRRANCGLRCVTLPLHNHEDSAESARRYPLAKQASCELEGIRLCGKDESGVSCSCFLRPTPVLSRGGPSAFSMEQDGHPAAGSGTIVRPRCSHLNSLEGTWDERASHNKYAADITQSAARPMHRIQS